MGLDPTIYGLPAPNQNLFEAHPTVSVAPPLRLGSADVIPKSNVSRLDGPTVHFIDGVSDEFDVIVLRHGSTSLFPVLLSGLAQRLGQPHPVVQAMFKPGSEISR